MKEIEIKLRISDRAAVLRRVAELGWRVRQERALERNYVYDTPDKALRAAGSLLRVRDWAGVCLLTLKLPVNAAGPHKVKEEFEIEASDCAVLRKLLEGLGYRLAWRYEKYRTDFELKDAPGAIVLDETPIGAFLELEGEPAWIDRTALELGFALHNYVTDTYGTLFEDYRARNAGVEADMVFSGSG